MGDFLTPVTLTADTVEEFTLDLDYAYVGVLNVDGSARVSYSVDGDDPTVDGPFPILPAAIGELVIRAPRRNGPTVVKCISSGTPMVQVRGLPTID